jgi:hypothetical protein
MQSGSTLIGAILSMGSAMLALVPACVSAQSPFVIHGLHSDMTVEEASAQAAKLGADCQVIPNRPNDEGRNIQCDMRHCDEAAAAGDCSADDLSENSLSVAGHPIVSILLQAQEGSGRVTRIVLVYSGATESVAAGLIAAFGPTEADGTPSDALSWTSSRRWSWRSDQYRMGLINVPQWITLATDAASAPTPPAEAKATP